ncbi:cytochrome-c peroxidase [Simiduia aestuariiviva]|uniref:Cytochrome c peroxidase n=1 Tax=Simiduia aestuariiviva TaxID=1510459 RepID=A0A839UM91_9GAMM|nr:cytochrome c peroxidase [Simiduia aestuariiviva]MBB3167891.1 cytochrome c peroxidase [Simiduia aestuariiviva]
MFRTLVTTTSVAGICIGLFGCKQEPLTATPLKDFEAPFVFGHFQVPADNALTVERVALGRLLFYDPILSKNNQVSCASCHQQARAFADGKHTSVGVSGKPLAFNSMSLVNLLWGPQHFFWDGRAKSLEAQALVPIQHPDEMGQDLDILVKELSTHAEYPSLFAAAYGDISPQHIAAALASFQRTLISANSRYDQYLRGEITLTDQEELGRKLFMAHPDAKASQRGGNCIDCHSQFVTAGFSTRLDGFSNNGLDVEADLKPGLAAVTGKPEHRGLFKVPSLRNIAVTAPYMHDGRFATLAQVLAHYNSGIEPSTTLSPLIVEANNQVSDTAGAISLNLSESEQQAIIAFLHTLTDTDFLTNPAFSDPFNRAQDATAQVSKDAR